MEPGTEPGSHVHVVACAVAILVSVVNFTEPNIVHTTHCNLKAPLQTDGRITVTVLVEIIKEVFTLIDHEATNMSEENITEVFLELPTPKVPYGKKTKIISNVALHTQ